MNSVSRGAAAFALAAAVFLAGLGSYGFVEPSDARYAEIAREMHVSGDFVYPTLSGESRTARVRLVMPNPGGVLKPQMFGNIELTVKLGERLTVPDQAVIDTGARKIVYVDRGEGLFEPREVATGLVGEGRTEVLRGLKEGERVASSANFLIDSEAQLRGVAPLPR